MTSTLSSVPSYPTCGNCRRSEAFNGTFEEKYGYLVVWLTERFSMARLRAGSRSSAGLARRAGSYLSGSQDDGSDRGVSENVRHEGENRRGGRRARLSKGISRHFPGYGGARRLGAPSRESSCCGCPIGSLSMELNAPDEELRADCDRAFLSLLRAESGESK